MKILHIHSDKKFLNHVVYYSNSGINNTIIFLGEKFENSDNIIFYSKNNSAYTDISLLARDYDVVVFMSMCLQHALICTRLPKNVKVIWRFFGGELYPFLQQEILTEKSRRFLKRNRLHSVLSFIKNTLLYGSSANNIFWQAVKRANYFMGLSKEEYDFLHERFETIPEFLQAPFIRKNEIDVCRKKQPTIVVGHSKNIDGNHLDILDDILGCSIKEEYCYILFFSYSEYSKKYTGTVIGKALKCCNFRIVEQVLPLEEFNEIQRTSSAIVINAKRQIAMGNIFSAICNGMKIYLHPQNVMYNWFSRHGIKIFPTSDFLKDLEDGNILLPDDIMESNIVHYNKLALTYNVLDFQNFLLTLNNAM